jgi:RHS repeat-associated protein
VYVTTGNHPEILLERSVYGKNQPDRNLNGQLFRHYDGAGLASYERYDFKGNLLESARQLAADYDKAPNWMPLENLSAAADLDAAAAALLSSGDRYLAATRFDALNRPIQTITPHRAGARMDVIQTIYAPNGLVDQVDVWIREVNAPTAWLDTGTAEQHAVTAIDYNARGQRARLALGGLANNPATQTTYAYDPLTLRLTRLTTERAGSFAANKRTVQDLSYTYDPAGNVTFIRDDADSQNVIFFNNQRVEPSAGYTYDAVYRLVRATGREHLGQNGGALNAPQQVENDDGFRSGLLHPGDGMAMGNYTEIYTYDPAGNLTSLAHHVSSGSWTRRYTYSELSRIDPAETGNRLSTTSLPGDPDGGPYTASYSYDVHGSSLSMPHLSSLTWDELDRLRSSARQAVNNATPETTFYVYESGGQRIRKVTNRANTSRGAERIYLGGFEIYREFDPTGATPTFERETLAVSAAGEHVLIVETETIGGAAQLFRYQYTNHLGTAVLELSELAEIISYEETFPYGSTSYQAVRSQTETPKRYRFSGKERDSESDLYYFGARYYASWLGRWISTDPVQTRDGLNLYAYARGSPTRLVDPAGTQNDDPPRLQLPTPSLLDSRSAEERRAERYAHALGDYHLRTQPVNLFPGGQGPGVPAFADFGSIPSSPQARNPTAGSGGSSSAGDDRPSPISDGPGTHVHFSPLLPHLDVSRGSVHFVTDVGLGSTTLGLTGIGPAGLTSFALEGGYSGKFTLTGRSPQGSLAVGYDISSNTATFSANKALPGGANFGFTMNSQAHVGISISGGGPFVPLVRPTPGALGVSPQNFGDPFNAAGNAITGMVQQTPGLLQNPSFGNIGGFISQHTATGPGRPESDFTNIGRGVDAARAVGTPSQHPTGPDIRYGAALTLDPNPRGGGPAVRFTAGLQIVY